MFGLNKLADRDFIIGFVLPVLISYLAAAGLFYDYLPSTEFVAKLAEDKSFASLTVVVLAVWTGATILMALNRILYRLLEGYVGPLAREDWRNEAREQRKQKLAKLHLCYENCYFNKSVDLTDQISEARRIYASLRAQFLIEFPSDALVMPTSFGNTVRAFENYSNEVYKLDGISGWSRLIGVLPPNYVSIINDAHAEVDFWVNCCCLSALISLAAATRVGFDIIMVVWGGSKFALMDFYLGVYSAILLYLSSLFYKCANERAIDWGSSVKSAFDLYLPVLAKQLGYELPKTRSGPLGQDEFWDSVTAMFLVQTPLRSEEWKAVSSSDGKASEAKVDSVDKEKSEGEADAGGENSDSNSDSSPPDVEAQDPLPPKEETLDKNEANAPQII